MSLKNSNDTIGNRIRDLPVCSHYATARPFVIDVNNIPLYWYTTRWHPLNLYSNEIVLQWLYLSNVQIVVTEQYETIHLNLILVEPAGCSELNCVGLVSDVMSGFCEHGDEFLVWRKREMPWTREQLSALTLLSCAVDAVIASRGT